MEEIENKIVMDSSIDFDKEWLKPFKHLSEFFFPVFFEENLKNASVYTIDYRVGPEHDYPSDQSNLTFGDSKYIFRNKSSESGSGYNRHLDFIF